MSVFQAHAIGRGRFLDTWMRVLAGGAAMTLCLAVVFPPAARGAGGCPPDRPYAFNVTNRCDFPVWIGQHDSTNVNSYPPLGASCTQNSDCGTGGTCDTSKGQCINWALSGRCTADDDCGTSGNCDTATGQCVCTTADACPGNAPCINGRCSVTATFCLPDLWTSGVFWPRTGCTPTADGHLNCDTGQCNPEGGTDGLVDCASQKTGPLSPIALFEATLNADSVNYDVSLASGYNTALTVSPVGGSHRLAGVPASENKVACFSSTCQTDLNATCPPLLQVKNAAGKTIGCDWPCHLCTSPDPPPGLKCNDAILKDASGNDTALTIDCSNAQTAGSAGGQIALDTSAPYPTANHTATFTVTANAGYSIAGVTGCGGTLAGGTYTTGLITAACTVTATFLHTDTTTTTSTFTLDLPTYVEMYCAKSYPDTRTGDDVPVMASTNQGTPVAFSALDCFPDKQFVIPTSYPDGYQPPAGQGVCLYTRSPQIDIPHFNDYNWVDHLSGNTQYCGGAPPDYNPLPDGTPCGGYMTSGQYFDNASGYTCQTVTFDDATNTSQTAHLCLPPTTSGLGMCRQSTTDSNGLKLRAFEGVGGPFNAAWITAGIQAGSGKPYYETFKKACPNAYTWQYDDDSGGYQCFFESTTSTATDFSGFDVAICGEARTPKLSDAINIFQICVGDKAVSADGLDWNDNGRVDVPDALFILQDEAKAR